MQQLDKRGIVGVVLLVIGVMALIGAFDTHSSLAADPDRYLSESDRDRGDFDSDELEVILEDAPWKPGIAGESRGIRGLRCAHGRFRR